jgi:hypothetical protein
VHEGSLSPRGGRGASHVGCFGNGDVGRNRRHRQTRAIFLVPKTCITLREATSRLRREGKERMSTAFDVDLLTEKAIYVETGGRGRGALFFCF